MTLLTKVAKSELTSSTLIFAKIAMRAAKTADRAAIRAAKKIDTGLEEADHPSASTGAYRRPTGSGRCLPSTTHRFHCKGEAIIPPGQSDRPRQARRPGGAKA